ncbi:MAG: beta-galactosidase [Candidatus Merdivicinus sp.]|jgi:beta-galactosidase
MSRLTFDAKQFYLDGKPFRILSGTIHYFRVVPEYWEDRLKKLRACGFNTVETYTCWNLHERREGEFNFTGNLDIARFIRTAQDLGLYVILRPGPYICAELEFGGLPSWLLTYPKMHLRCCDPDFLEKVSRYYRRLFAEIRPYLGENGGNVIAVQVENEYGSYGNDKDYLRAVAKIYEENDIRELYFTSDGTNDLMLGGGTLPEYLATANFGSRGKENFDALRRFRPNQPVMCTEFWNGWFDHWYEAHHVREGDDTAQTFEEMLTDGGSVNFYMFHGGTNFGFMNGANYAEHYQPTVTSYDYDAPVSENGDLTPKYFAIREVIAKHFGNVPDIPVENLPKKSYGKVMLSQQASLFANKPEPICCAHTRTMEELGQDFGFVLYETTVKGPVEESEVIIDGLHDRAILYLNGQKAGIKERTGHWNDAVKIHLKNGETAKLSLLVENMGRVNYGPKLRDEKGILHGVKVGYQYQFGWEMYRFPCDDLSGLHYEQELDSRDCPAFLKGTFQVSEKADTFVRLDGFTKGCVYINGFNLGRYWNTAGPQKTLYLPAPLLREGENELVVLELEGFEKPEILLTDERDLG